MTHSTSSRHLLIVHRRAVRHRVGAVAAHLVARHRRPVRHPHRRRPRVAAREGEGAEDADSQEDDRPDDDDKGLLVHACTPFVAAHMTLTTISRPPGSLPSFVRWWPMWQWKTHFPGRSGVNAMSYRSP